VAAPVCGQASFPPGGIFFAGLFSGLLISCVDPYI
jgi:hypothetical protein